MSDERTFPDISFVDPDASAILSEMITGYESETGRTLYPADPVRILLNYVAAVISQERAKINDSAKMNMPRFARGDYLDSLAEIFRGVERLEAVPAECILKFTISAAQEVGVIIPAGTRATADGSITFSTVSDIVIPAGEVSGTVKAVCDIPGTVGNGYLAGQVKNCVDIFPFFSAVENLDATGGGSDRESDSGLYERMRESVEGYSTAGPAGAYIYHAKSASALIEDVTATSPSAGNVDIRVLLKNGKFPDQAVLDIVSAALNDEKIRPLTDHVTVYAPTEKAFNVALTYYVESGGELSLSDAASAVESAVADYIEWQTAKIGRDIDPSKLIQLVMNTGVKRVVVTSPVYTPVGATEAAKLGTKTVSAGGYEDE
ncbi:possible phage baseplate protein [Eubacterium sp. CAG:786]|jgi:phage-related baseplate assembly protein|nr:possible phage baseplate protein [Eubacterium sp. CAG:786]